MSLLTYLIIYLAISLIVTYLLTCAFSLSHPLPDRRKYDRRKEMRLGHIDRRVSYRNQYEENRRKIEIMSK